MVRTTYNKQLSISEERQEQNAFRCFRYLLSLFSQRTGESEKDYTDIAAGDDKPTNLSIKKTRASDLIGPKTSEIRVIVEGQERSLGITLISYPYPENQAFMKCQHRLVPDKDNLIAKRMKMRDQDELIILQEENFLPTRTHTEVLNLFRDIKVDGETLTKMTIRRKTRFNNWKWYEMQTIFAPGSETAMDVTVLCPHTETYKLKKCNIREQLPESLHMYKVPDTQFYLMVDDTGLSANPIYDDSCTESKLIIKEVVMCVHKQGDYHFYTSLKDKLRSRYISVNGDDARVILADQPHLFEFRQEGNRTEFAVEGKGLYLAYDHETRDVKTTRTKFMFEEHSPSQELFD